MVNVQDLMPVVMTLLLVGMIVGVGTLTLDKFGQAVRIDTTATDEVVTFTAGVGEATNDFITSITSAVNNSAAEETVTVVVQDYETGTLTVTPSDVAEAKVTYVYGATSETTTAVNSGRDAVAGISTEWMGLVVTILVLSLILGLTIAGFAYFGNRR